MEAINVIVRYYIYSINVDNVKGDVLERYIFIKHCPVLSYWTTIKIDCVYLFVEQ